MDNIQDKEKEAKVDFNFEKELNIENKWPKNFKIIFGIATGVIVLLIIALIVVAVCLSKDKNNSTEKENYYSQQNIYYGTYKVYQNLPYSVNDEIENSFKKGGENYIDGLGDLNNGENYQKNERNVYDLYFPDSALEYNNKINGVILWIHGGSWTGGTKDDMSAITQIFIEHGYISANMGYTILSDQFETFNIYRIMDEITSAIKAIKKELESRGFNGSKLRLAIGGYSAGSHLALLYSYLIKNVDIIPLRFIIDFVGPIGLQKNFFYKLSSNDNTLENISDVSLIETAIQEGKLIPVANELTILGLMNAFYGNKYTQDELNEMLDEQGSINKDNEKYKTMDSFIKYSDISRIEDKHKIPTICIYGGTDEVLGVSSFAYLKQKADEDGRHLDLVYYRYDGHALIIPMNVDGVIKAWHSSILITNYIQKYFSD